jgi:hypothetical protein
MNHILATARSANDFETVVLPQIRKWLPDCRYYSFESLKDTADPVSREIFTIFDDKCGCDGMLYNAPHECAKLVGVRVQRKGMDYSTFTIRYERWAGTKTEFQKRRESIERDELFPHITIQAYLTLDGKLMSVGMCSTRDLFSYINNGGSYHFQTVHEFGGAVFMVVKWVDLSKRYNVYEYQASMADLYC